MGSAGALPPAILPLRNSLVFLSSKFGMKRIQSYSYKKRKNKLPNTHIFVGFSTIKHRKNYKIEEFFVVENFPETVREPIQRKMKGTF